MKKLLIVYNTCGISGRSNIEGYISSLNSILRQDIEDVEVVVSACMNSASDIAALKETFPDMLNILS